MTIPTVDSIMSTRPCVGWPRARVEAVLEQLGHPSSWVQLAERARAAGWPVSLLDLRLTAYRAASPEQRLAGVKHSMQVSSEAIASWPDASAAVARIQARLLAWANGGDEPLSDIRADAAYARAAADVTKTVYEAYDATTFYARAASKAGANANDFAAAYASAAAGSAARAAYGAGAAWASLVYICQLLDGTADL